MNGKSIAGSCFCGHVRFELRGQPVFVCHCHCSSCQRASGAPFITWASFSREDLDITEGSIAEYRSSAGVQRGHCADCGTTLTYAHDKRPDEIDIAVTSLDDAAQFTPEAHIWVEDKAPWVVLGDELPVYPRTVST